MVFKLLVICLIGLGFIQSSFAEETCVASATQLAAKKASFPKFLQETPPVMFTRDSFPIAALSFRIVDGKIQGEAIYKVFGIKRDNGYVSKLCFDGTELTVELEVGSDKNKKEYRVKILDDSTIEVNGVQFKQSSPVHFAKILESKLTEKKNNNDSAATTQAGSK
jgi:hypothetical protein